jgi:GH25 family lysozyme M1 (1,4-beta-N-acetylmuramidase)
MLAGEIIFYNRFSNEAIHRIDIEGVDIESYHHSREFYTIIF